MRAFLARCVLLTLCATLQGAVSGQQANAWAWVGGTSSAGVKPTAEPAPFPGGRENPYIWQAPNGDLWLYGGRFVGGVMESSSCDVWRYQTSSKTWTEMRAGESTTVYGTKGVEDVANSPGSRSDAVAWSDDGGNLWIYGGFSGSYRCSDLWRFNISSCHWTWIAGGQENDREPAFGTKGVASPTNTPGPRTSHSSAVFADGALYLFGGTVTGQSNDWNDLWRFDLATLMWTWIEGASVPNESSIYPESQSGSNSTRPGARADAAMCASSSDLWLFGGYGLDQNRFRNNLNDLWKFDVASQRWQCLRKLAPAKYGIKGEFTREHTPGGRNESRIVATNGQLWVFGGYGVDASLFFRGDLNDLWCYDTRLESWAWVSGANTTNNYGIYGTQGVADIGNIPGSRKGFGMLAQQTKLLLYGGRGYSTSSSGLLGDLWEFDTAQPASANCWMLFN